MAQTLKQRRQAQSRPIGSGRNLLTLALCILAVLFTFYYVLPAVTSGDWQWYSTEFKEQPASITIVERGRRTTIDSSDPRFARLASAFNQSIEQGYRVSSRGISEATWERIDNDGLYVETSYAQPVRLHLRGGFIPTTKMMILIGGKDIHFESILLRSNPDNWDTLPIEVDDIEPLKNVLAEQGFRAAE